MTLDQAAKVRDARLMGGYLFRLVARMDRTNLRTADPKLSARARISARGPISRSPGPLAAMSQVHTGRHAL